MDRDFFSYQRFGFPKRRCVETGHSSTSYLYDMHSYHTDACAHMHTNKKKTYNASRSLVPYRYMCAHAHKHKKPYNASNLL